MEMTPRRNNQPAPQKQIKKKISFVIPRSTWVFEMLTNESKEEARNRFIYSILINTPFKDQLIETLFDESYVRESVETDKVNAYSTDSISEIVNKVTLNKVLRFTKSET